MDGRVGVQRVAVAVQAGNRHTCSFEQRQVLIAGSIADQNFIDGRHVDGRQEHAGVDLDAGQAEVGDDLQGLGQWTVAQDRVVDTQPHAVLSFERAPYGRWSALTKGRSSSLSCQ
jgi:hypothetical protein